MNSRLLIVGSPYKHPNKRSFTQKFVNILSSVSDEVTYIGANSPDDEPANAEYICIEFERSNNILNRIISFVNYQLRVKRMINDESYNGVIIRPQIFVMLAIYLRIKAESFAVFAAQAQESILLQKLSIATFWVAENLIIESSETFGWHPSQINKKCLDGRTYVDTNRFSPLNKKESENFIVGYLGLLSERKGIPQLLESIKILNSNNVVDAEFRFGGSGEYEQAVSEAQESYDNVTFDGFIPEEDLADFYRDLDVLILPSESEGLPNVLLEAMACGTPPLVTNVGGVPQLIEDGSNGFILPSREPETIANKLVDIRQSGSINAVSAEAISTVRSNYSQEEAVERYEKIVQSLCETQV